MKKYLLIWLIAIQGLAYAQSGRVMEISLLGQAEGLIETKNYFCMKDSKGMIWISSLTGVYLFDGVKVTRINRSISGQNVNGYFLEDSDSNIWFSTNEAIHCYHRKADTIHVLQVDKKSSSTYFTFTLDSKNRLWFSKNDSIFTLDIHTKNSSFITKALKGTQRFKAHYSQSGHLRYIACFSMDGSYSGLELLEFENDQLQSRARLFDGDNGPALAPRDINFMHENSLYVGSSLGLTKYDLSIKEFSNFPLIEKNKNELVHSIAQISENELLLGTYSGKLFRFDLSSGTYSDPVLLSVNESVISAPIQAMYQDAEGGIWLTLPKLGVGYLHPKFFNFEYYPMTFKSRHLESGVNPNSVLLIDNQIWLGLNDHGIAVLDTNLSVLKHWHHENSEIPVNVSNQVFFDKTNQHIWVLSYNHSYIINTDGKLITKLHHDGVKPLSICQKSSGEIIYSDINKGGLFTAEFINNSYQFQVVRAVEENKVFTFLHRLKNGDIAGSFNLSTFTILNPNTQFETKFEVPVSGDVNCLLELDENKLLLGTDNGIVAVDPNRQTHEKIELSCLQGLNIWGMIPVSDSILWVSTNYGLYNLDLRMWHCAGYVESFGLSDVQFNKRALLKLPGGEILVGSPKGITKFDPYGIIEPELTAPVKITSVLINDLSPERLNYTYKQKVNTDANAYKLKFEDNTISLNFGSLDYRGTGKAQYEYRLIPTDTSWFKTERKGFARFANLDPGNHTFQVRTVSPNTLKTGPVTALSIEITPPFYQKPWFILLVISVVFALIYWAVDFYQRRKRRILKLQFEKKLALEKQRLRIATDLHDDLGSGLSALALRAKVLTSKIKEHQQKAELEQLAVNANNLTQQVRETIWSVNSKNDSLDKLVTRIHQYTMEYFAHSSIDCKITLPVIKTDHEIDGLHRRNIYLACKEAIHNVLKHAEATQVKLIISYDNKKVLQIRISDNGKGFEYSPQSNSGLGLRSMSTRMESIGGKFELHSDSKGTRIILTYLLS